MVQLPLQTQSTARIGIWLSIILYTALAGIKLWTGIVTHSQAVFADGLNNISDILLSVAILVGIKVSRQPADDNHPFGHTKAETISTLIAASFMVLVAIHVWLKALQEIWNSTETVIPPMALYVSLGAIVPLLIVSWINLRLSRKTNSQALRAAAFDSATDALVSLGAGVGILGNLLGYQWMDPLAAFLVGILILRTGWEIGKPAIHVLMDGFDQEKVASIEKKVIKIEGIHQVKELRARNVGPYVFVEITVGIDPTLSVQESHILTEEIEDTLKGYHNIEHVHVHVEPAFG